MNHCLSFCSLSFGHFIVCLSSIYGFWLLLWYLQTFLTASDYPLVSSNFSYIFWLPRGIFKLFLQLLITPWYLQTFLTASDYPLVSSNFSYSFWLPLQMVSQTFLNIHLICSFIITSSSTYVPNLFYHMHASIYIVQ